MLKNNKKNINDDERIKYTILLFGNNKGEMLPPIIKMDGYVRNL